MALTQPLPLGGGFSASFTLDSATSASSALFSAMRIPIVSQIGVMLYRSVDSAGSANVGVSATLFGQWNTDTVGWDSYASSAVSLNSMTIVSSAAALLGSFSTMSGGPPYIGANIRVSNTNALSSASVTVALFPLPQNFQ